MLVVPILRSCEALLYVANTISGQCLASVMYVSFVMYCIITKYSVRDDLELVFELHEKLKESKNLVL